MVLNIALGTVEAIAARFVNEYPDRRAEVLAEVVRLVDDVRAATGHRH
jgi:hypothetical protein